MSKLKNQLIRLGNTNPELRKDLKPVLAHLDKQADVGKPRDYLAKAYQELKKADTAILKDLHADLSLSGGMTPNERALEKAAGKLESILYELGELMKL